MIQSFQIGAKGLFCVNGSVLLLRDREFWDLPGGRIDGEETPLEALSRELQEELPGISHIAIGPLVGWHRLSSVVPRKDHALMLLIFLVNATLPEPITLSEEHDSAHWLPIETAIGQCAQLSAIDWERVTSTWTSNPGSGS